MDQPVKSLSRRLRRNLAISVLVSALAALAYSAQSITLVDESFVSGWALAAVIVLLALYNIRRSLPFLPLGSSSAWLQLHAYAGLIGIVLYALHAGLAIPRAPLERLLAGLFVLVAGSGAVGLAIARILPSRLSRRGEEVLYERIPKFRRQLRDRAEALALRAVEETGSTTIADYYADRLRPLFESRGNFWEHVIEVDRGRHRLLGEMRDLERYLDDNEMAILREMAELAETKDDLDYQYALQSMLKTWQLVHVPLTYGLLVFILLHLVVVYAFA
jgi:hypothetical protein